MERKTVDVLGFTFEVVRATMRHGIERGLLIEDGRQAVKKDPEMHRSLQLLRVYFYPDLMAATESFVTPDGNEDLPTFEVFAEMPDECYEPWSDAVYALNPHWQIKDDADTKKDAEKKASKSDAD